MPAGQVTLRYPDFLVSVKVAPATLEPPLDLWEGWGEDQTLAKPDIAVLAFDCGCQRAIFIAVSRL